MRWVKIEDVGDTEFLIEEQVDRFRFMEENERVIADRRTSGDGPAAAARDHEGVALDRLVHLGGVVPGDDARAHRGVDFGQGGSPARPEGERHDGPADPGRDRASSTTGTCGSRRTSRRRRRRRPRRSSSSSARWSTSWSRKRRSRGTRSSSALPIGDCRLPIYGLAIRVIVDWECRDLQAALQGRWCSTSPPLFLCTESKDGEASKERLSTNSLGRLP